MDTVFVVCRKLFHIADRLVFKKVRKALGLDRCRYQLTGAAPISKETLEFFLSLGLPLYEVFGMSECAGTATFSTPQRSKIGSAGVRLPHVELDVAKDGEIYSRSKCISGSLKMKKQQMEL